MFEIFIIIMLGIAIFWISEKMAAKKKKDSEALRAQTDQSATPAKSEKIDIIEKSIKKVNEKVRDLSKKQSNISKIIITGQPRAGKTVFCAKALDLLLEQINSGESEESNLYFDKAMKNAVSETYRIIKSGAWPASTNQPIEGHVEMFFKKNDHSFSLVDLPGEYLAAFADEPPTDSIDSSPFDDYLREADGAFIIIDSGQLTWESYGPLDDILFNFFNSAAWKQSSLKRMALVLTKADIYAKLHSELDTHEELLKKTLRHSYPCLVNFKKIKPSFQHKIFMVSAVSTRIDYDGNCVPNESLAADNQKMEKRDFSLLAPFLWLLDIPLDIVDTNVDKGSNTL